jgi:hypothetical protein
MSVQLQIFLDAVGVGFVGPSTRPTCFPVDDVREEIPEVHGWGSLSRFHTPITGLKAHLVATELLEEKPAISSLELQHAAFRRNAFWT